MTAQEKQAQKIKESCKSIDKNVEITEYNEDGVIILKTIFTDKYKYACCGNEKHKRDGVYYIYGDGHLDFY